jgi:DNA-binding LacI/PurR family transcriptional regulator
MKPDTDSRSAAGLESRAGQRRRPTLDDVAALAGCSRRVVAAVLNPASAATVRFSANTRARVEDAIRRVGYRRNRTAESLRRGRHGAIGVLSRSLYYLPHEMLVHLLAETTRRGLQLLMEGCSPGGELPALVTEDSIDALIVFEDLPAGVAGRVRALPIPVLEVNTSNRTGSNAITFDDEGAARSVAERFAGRGCRGLVFMMSAPGDHYSYAARWEGLCEGARNGGLSVPVRCEVTGPFISKVRSRESVDEIADFLAAHPSADGFLLQSELMAPILYDAAARLGRRIGEDLAIVGFNDTLAAWALSPQLTTLGIATGPLASAVLDMIQSLTGGEPAPGPRTIPWRLLERGSS